MTWPEGVRVTRQEFSRRAFELVIRALEEHYLENGLRRGEADALRALGILGPRRYQLAEYSLLPNVIWTWPASASPRSIWASRHLARSSSTRPRGRGIRVE